MTDTGKGAKALGVLGGLGILAWLFLRKKAPSVPPGATIVASIKFEYSGDADTYTLQNSFGSAQNGFIPALGMVWSMEIMLAASAEFTPYEFALNCPIPANASSGKYDAEVVIKRGDAVLARTVVRDAVVIQ